MVTCCIHLCSHRSGRDAVKFFRIPSIQNGCPLTVYNSTNQRTTWFARINRQCVNNHTATRNTVVCSKHFISGKPAGYMKTTHPDWAPSCHLGYETNFKNDRYERYRIRRPLGAIENIHNDGEIVYNDSADVSAELSFSADLSVSADLSESEIETGIGCQTDTVCEMDVECQTDTVCEMDIECQTDIDSIALNNLMEKSRPVFSEEHLSADAKCRFYTGVPSFEVLKILFDLVGPHVKKVYKKTSVSKFQEFASVLARLRLGLLEEDIADRLRISQSCVSKIFNLWVPVMAQCFKHFIVWPDRETLRKTMPDCFVKSFGRSVAVVVDCFEVQAPTPSGLLAKAQTYSHYKKNSTVKFLIGITPQGTVSYISDAWGGRTSDKFITEHSKDFLDNLLPGDVILADRGFDIGMVTGELLARVITPSFMNGRNQLSADDVEYSRSVANVRIHVERLIGLVRRKFLVLEHRLNYSMLQHGQGQHDVRIDHIVLICCAISNLCNAIVPMTDVSEATDL